MAERNEQRRSDLFDELAKTGSITARNELVESYAPLAEYFANRYKRGFGEHEDLRQVAHLALVKAVDRFDPTYGVGFSTFAGRTIDGELKRHFRDKTWVVRVPRSLQESAIEVRNAVDQLSSDNNRSPTVTELAAATGYTEDEVLEALDVQSAQQASSLNEPSGEPGALAPALSMKLATIDENFERADAAVTVEALIEQLTGRERSIVMLHFYEDLTQQQIGERLGISQMHVSRLMRAALLRLRSHLGDTS